jgi:gamma-glutamylcyclotransferase (GGCT)/AIG2-like uncharacterized protein YtfP
MTPHNEKACLFVYGTLRRGSRNDHSGRNEILALLAKYGRSLGPARLQGRLFMVKHFPGAVHSDAPNMWVHGAVYELPSNDTIWQQLDDYEECSAKFPTPTLYCRWKKTVVLENGITVDAWVYMYNRPTDGLTEIPSGDFLEYTRTTDDR